MTIEEKVAVVTGAASVNRTALVRFEARLLPRKEPGQGTSRAGNQSVWAKYRCKYVSKVIVSDVSSRFCSSSDSAATLL